MSFSQNWRQFLTPDSLTVYCKLSLKSSAVRKGLRIAVGATIAVEWQFPDVVTDAIARHPDPESRPRIPIPIPDPGSRMLPDP